MENHKQKVIAKGDICTIAKCSCGIYHIHYQFITIRVRQDGMIKLLQILAKLEKETRGKRPDHYLQIKFGTISLTMAENDFVDFFNMVQEALTDEIELPNFFQKNMKEQQEESS